MDEKKQFDSLLGGDQQLPTSLNLMSFALARSKEIIEMKKALKKNKSTKLAFQTLPKHMRRRCMSHNSNRLPRRLREIHLRQLMKSGMPPKQKRPSRKHRRRTKNLVNRQRNNRWLETHIWHAKRFHMIERWGYRLPDRPCDKSFRACYRATVQHCLIQDISYYNCIEIEGEQDVVINEFKTLCDSSTGLSLGAKAYIKGNRQGTLMVFKKNTKKAIGNVHFHWKPSDLSRRILWLWVHAAYYKEILDILIDCFQLREVTEHLYENILGHITLRELKYDLNRLRLIGPLSNAILQQAFKLADSKESAIWLDNYLTDNNNKKRFNEQNQYWLKMKNLTTSQLSPHVILSLVIADPRFTLPKKRTTILPDLSGYFLDYNNSVPLCFGPIWEREIREIVKETKPSNEEINNLRSNLLVPGTDLTGTGVPLPVLLIQNPGNRDDKAGYCSGWDLILPSGWAQPIWLSLIMHGAKPGGIRETNSMQFELGKPSIFPPDTEAGELECKRIAEELKNKYFKRPPNKRINYNRFAIVCPFYVNWKLLVNEWGGGEHFTVLREIKQLNMLQEILKRKVKKIVTNIDCTNCIVPIKVEMRKGKPSLCAIICLSKEEDLLKGNEPIEPFKVDEYKEVRKEVRAAHKTLLKKLKRKRKNDRKAGKITKIDLEMYLDFNKKMRQLWLPDPKGIRNSCSREIIGFVTAGDYSLKQGKGCGVGYVTMGGLQTLLSTTVQNKVLIRNTNSRQYRVASIEIAI